MDTLNGKYVRTPCALTGSQNDRRLEPSDSAPHLLFRGPHGISLVRELRRWLPGKD